MHEGLPAVVERKLEPVQRYGLRLTLFGVAILLVAVPFGVLLEQVVTDGPVTHWDADIAESLHAQVVDRPVVISVLEVLSFLGKPIWLLFAVGIPALWLARRGHWHLALFLAVTSVGGGIIDTIVKVLVARPRPILDEPISSARGNSFPSGHAMSSTVCYGALLVAFAVALDPRARRLATAAVVALVTGISFSRLALGVHYVSDVVGGIVLGVAWLAASVAAWEIWREDRGLRRTAALAEGVEPEDVAG